MDIRTLKQEAARLSAGGKRLALIHAAVAVGASVLLALISFLLDSQIANTAGLGGLATRAALSSARTVLTLAVTVALPFWDLGYLKAALCHARSQQPDFSTLPEGFRRFGPALRTMLLRALLVILVSLACVQVASSVYFFSPMSNKLLEAMEEILQSGSQTLDPATLESLLPMLVPVYIIAGALACGVLIPLLYRFRLADWAIMDDHIGALYAFKISSSLMRHRRLAWFKLDLSFWWYYLLLMGSVALGYGDTLLSALGASLDPQLSYVLFYGLSLAVQLVVFWQFAPRVQTTYALAYHHRQEECKIPGDH